jgi:hypothetical protein
VQVERLRILIEVTRGAKIFYYTEKNGNNIYYEIQNISQGAARPIYIAKETILVIQSSGLTTKMSVTVDGDNKIIASSTDKTMFAINIQSSGMITVGAAS